MRVEELVLSSLPDQRANILATMIRQDGFMVGGPMKRFGHERGGPIDEKSAFLMECVAQIRGRPFPMNSVVPESVVIKFANIPRPFRPDLLITVRQALSALMQYPSHAYGDRLAYEVDLLNRLQQHMDPFTEVSMTIPRALMLISMYFNMPIAAKNLKDFLAPEHQEYQEY